MVLPVKERVEKHRAKMKEQAGGIERMRALNRAHNARYRKKKQLKRLVEEATTKKTDLDPVQRQEVENKTLKYKTSVLMKEITTDQDNLMDQKLDLDIKLLNYEIKEIKIVQRRTRQRNQFSSDSRIKEESGDSFEIETKTLLSMSEDCVIDNILINFTDFFGQEAVDEVSQE